MKKKMVSIFLLGVMLLNFGGVATFAAGDAEVNQSSICGIYQNFEYGTKEVYQNFKDIIKYAAEVVSYRLGEIWNHRNEMYDYSSDGLGKVWNATKDITLNAYDYSSYGLGKAWNATSSAYCDHIGFGCANNVAT